VEKKRERNMKMADAILEFQKEARPKLHPSLVLVLAEREGGREWDILRYAEDRKKVVMIEINMRDKKVNHKNFDPYCKDWDGYDYFNDGVVMYNYMAESQWKVAEIEGQVAIVCGKFDIAKAEPFITVEGRSDTWEVTRALQKTLGYATYDLLPEENPYIRKFAENPNKMDLCLKGQLWFLKYRYLTLVNAYRQAVKTERAGHCQRGAIFNRIFWSTSLWVEPYANMGIMKANELEFYKYYRDKLAYDEYGKRIDLLWPHVCVFLESSSSSSSRLFEETNERVDSQQYENIIDEAYKSWIKEHKTKFIKVIQVDENASIVETVDKVVTEIKSIEFAPYYLSDSLRGWIGEDDYIRNKMIMDSEAFGIVWKGKDLKIHEKLLDRFLSN
jgi:deoxyadenosine/deoxycytidine kinase